MNEIALQGPIVDYQRNALVFLQRPSWEQAESLVNTLLTMEEAIQFWLGDCMLYLSSVFPANYEQLFPDGYAAKSLANMRWVASKVPVSRRREELSWSHHEAVSGLGDETQAEVLETAVLNDMTVSETRNAFREMKGEVPVSKPPKTVHVVCEECQHEMEIEV